MPKQLLLVDVLLPLPLPGTFTYAVPEEYADTVDIGKRVVVQFGKRKIYTALVWSVKQNNSMLADYKYILSVLDDSSIVVPIQYEFWQWLSDYYLSFLGDVMNAALPASFKLQSESSVVMNPRFDGDISGMNEKEIRILDALSINKILTLTEITEILQQKKVIHLVNTLIEKGVICMEEELQHKYKPKLEEYIKITETYANESNLKLLLDKLQKKANKQFELIMAYLSFQGFGSIEYEIKKETLLSKVSASTAILNAMIKKGIFQNHRKEITRLVDSEYEIDKMPELTDAQNDAMNKIYELWNDRKVVLLHGITASGKTEIYIRIINEYIKEKKQVLYLLPEIALTAQIINRLKRFFGSRIFVYHSRYTNNERAEIWMNLLKTNVNNDFCIVLGARSSIFLPFKNLGLIIVDEEHEPSFKQYDPSPRYNARDAAIYLAKLHNANVILGSATPSIESYHNAMTNKYGLVELNQRYFDVKLPEILIVDTKEAAKKRLMKSHFSQFLLEHIHEALARKEQVILFQNRRGFSNRIECSQCHWIPQCKNCDVTLTYHKASNLLKCHYCGYAIPPPDKCPVCNNTKITLFGFGTERIEEEIKLYLPDAHVARMDLDTTRSKNAYFKIINDLEDGSIDILVGTQMISKGLDFENVSLVCILNADTMLNFPDFRASERSYQLMAQVSGRAGRKNSRGKVIIQSYNPYHNIIRYVIENDYKSMFKDENLQRLNFNYPPFFRLIRLTLKHKDKKFLDIAADVLSYKLRTIKNILVLGPEYPLISRIKLYYLKDLLIKIPKNIDLQGIKLQIIAEINTFNTSEQAKNLRIAIDIDPL